MARERIIGFSIEAPKLKYGGTVAALATEIQFVPDDRPKELVELLGAQAEGLRRLSRLDGSEDLFRRCLRISLQKDLLGAQGWSFWGLASVLRARGAKSASARLYKEALAAARLSGDRRCELWSIAELSELDRMAGRYKQAIEMHTYLRKEFRSIGDWKGVCWASLGIAQIYRLIRFLDRSTAEFIHTLETSEELGNAVGAGWAVRGLAEVARERRDYAVSLALAKDCRERFLAIDYRLGSAYALKTQVDTLIDMDDYASAEHLATQCNQEFKACGEARGIGFALLTLGRLHAKQGEPGRAAILLKRSAKLLQLSSGSEPAAFSPSAELRRVRYMAAGRPLRRLCLAGKQNR